MKIKLKKGVKLRPIKNKYGLSLSEFYGLQAGRVITVDKMPDGLEGIVTEIKTKIKGDK